MASLDSVTLLSEAAFGCEHLAAIMQDQSTAGLFKDGYRKQYAALAPYTKPETAAVPTSGLRTVATLKPKYHCLSCFEGCLNTEREAHTKKTGHAFFMESRNRYVFCETCGDFVYDHGLERLCGPAGKFEYQGRWTEDSASEVYVKNNAYKNPCSRRGARGVWNMGQTCYQARNLCMGCAATEVFMEFNSGERTDAVSAATLLYHGWDLSREMAGYRQQDAHEYFQFLVNALHAATPGHSESYDTKCECFFHRTFYGELRSSVMCHKCGKTTHTFDPMIDLSLDVQLQNKKRKLGRSSAPGSASLINCLESFTAVEDLQHQTEAAYHCEKCGNTPQRASKRLQINKLPGILCMQLKRYEHNSSSSEKMDGHVDFPVTLNMLPYTVKKDKERVDTSNYLYDLSTVVVHKGAMDSGHYYSYTRLSGDKWVLMDDNKVTVASIADVLKQDAYLLFYSIRAIHPDK
ncbi:hypothetical protein N7539_006383 [Penicillium diatomitis]|uniref:USP domain-containing protein n=1 Tax=Penicillium diatomitis TaxID=2819901 RepID=A0A9W9X2V9_9EURO|nr:uncharacterized protein N7539_006383 [Penicillium diatomitis]KAJ5482937.1 hypothetical protein N7539_006383 [Penicillium diatomitis]